MFALAVFDLVFQY